VWYTPAHHLHLWKYRLARDRESLTVTAQPPGEDRAAPVPDSDPEPDPDAQEFASTEYIPQTPRDAENPPAAPVKPSQLGFDF